MRIRMIWNHKPKALCQGAVDILTLVPTALSRDFLKWPILTPCKQAVKERYVFSEFIFSDLRSEGAGWKDSLIGTVTLVLSQYNCTRNLNIVVPCLMKQDLSQHEIQMCNVLWKMIWSLEFEIMASLPLETSCLS